MNWEDYLIEGSSVLKNKLGITNQEELNKQENMIVVCKLLELYLTEINGNYDSKHLCDIHRYLFKDIYDFAGSYRCVYMYKKYGGFLEPNKIKDELERIMSEARNKVIDSDNKFEIAKFIGKYYYDLIMIHPFREGNGRTIREFIRQFVIYKFPDYVLDMEKLDKKNMLLGIVEIETYPLLLAYEFYNALTLKKEKVM